MNLTLLGPKAGLSLLSFPSPHHNSLRPDLQSSSTLFQFEGSSLIYVSDINIVVAWQIYRKFKTAATVVCGVLQNNFVQKHGAHSQQYFNQCDWQSELDNTWLQVYVYG